MLDAIAHHQALIVCIVTQTIAFAVFILRLWRTTNEHSIKIKDIENQLCKENDNLNDKLDKVTESLNDLREKVAELVGVLRASGHDVTRV